MKPSIPCATFKAWIANSCSTTHRGGTKLERLQEEKKKGAGRDKSLVERELALFEKFQGVLGKDIPLRDIEISAEEEKLLSGFGFLSRKPLMLVLNTSEGQTAPEIVYEHKHSNWSRCRENWKWISPSFRPMKPRFSCRIRH
jgi:ribosome-binding ATPase YchF (GTP1/OBG family)